MGSWTNLWLVRQAMDSVGCLSPPPMHAHSSARLREDVPTSRHWLMTYPLESLLLQLLTNFIQIWHTDYFGAITSTKTIQSSVRN